MSALVIEEVPSNGLCRGFSQVLTYAARAPQKEMEARHLGRHLEDRVAGHDGGGLAAGNVVAGRLLVGVDVPEGGARTGGPVDCARGDGRGSGHADGSGDRGGEKRGSGGEHHAGDAAQGLAESFAGGVLRLQRGVESPRLFRVLLDQVERDVFMKRIQRLRECVAHVLHRADVLGLAQQRRDFVKALPAPCSQFVPVLKGVAVGAGQGIPEGSVILIDDLRPPDDIEALPCGCGGEFGP